MVCLQIFDPPVTEWFACGLNRDNFTFVSSSDVINITFSTDNSMTDTGFFAYYSQTNTGNYQNHFTTSVFSKDLNSTANRLINLTCKC